MEIRSYKELETMLDIFRSGNIDLMIVQSEAGMGKSRAVEDGLKGRNYCLILSHLTPFQFFRLAYEHKDTPLFVIDDALTLLSNKENVSVLLQLANTEASKTLQWNSSKMPEDLPSEFNSKAKLLILCNSLNGLKDKLPAIVDRSLHVVFSPSTAEILNKISQIKYKVNGLEKEEADAVYKIIEIYAPYCRFSLRSYVKAVGIYKYCKEKGLDYTNFILRELGIDEKMLEMHRLLSEFRDDKSRLLRWKWSRSTFYEYKRKVRKSGLKQDAKQVCIV